MRGSKPAWRQASAQDVGDGVVVGADDPLLVGEVAEAHGGMAAQR
jgi:hypothetical protein